MCCTSTVPKTVPQSTAYVLPAELPPRTVPLLPQHCLNNVSVLSQLASGTVSVLPGHWDGCFLSCFAGDGLVAAGIWPEAAYPYFTEHPRFDEDDRYYQCAEHRHAD